IEASLGREFFDEVAVMVDTFRPLEMGEAGSSCEDPAYAWSWAGAERAQPDWAVRRRAAGRGRRLAHRARSRSLLRSARAAGLALGRQRLAAGGVAEDDLQLTTAALEDDSVDAERTVGLLGLPVEGHLHQLGERSGLTGEELGVARD